MRRARAHIPGVLLMFPCALPWGEEPKDRLPLQNLMAIRITPDSCPMHTRIMHLHTVSHPSHILVLLVGPVEGDWRLWCKVHLPSLPSIQQMLLGVEWAHCWKSNKSSNTTSKLRIICESHPRITPPNQPYMLPLLGLGQEVGPHRACAAPDQPTHGVGRREI